MPEQKIDSVDRIFLNWASEIMDSLSALLAQLGGLLATSAINLSASYSDAFKT